MIPVGTEEPGLVFQAREVPAWGARTWQEAPRLLDTDWGTYPQKPRGLRSELTPGGGSG